MKFLNELAKNSCAWNKKDLGFDSLRLPSKSPAARGSALSRDDKVGRLKDDNEVADDGVADAAGHSRKIVIPAKAGDPGISFSITVR